MAKIGSNVVSDKVTGTMDFRIDFSETGITNFTASDAVFSSKDSGHTVKVSDPGDANRVNRRDISYKPADGMRRKCNINSHRL